MGDAVATGSAESGDSPVCKCGAPAGEAAPCPVCGARLCADCYLEHCLLSPECD